MSGMFKSTGGYKSPSLPDRPELEKTNPDAPNNLPIRNEIRVVASIDKNLEPLALVTKKFQVAGQPTLSFKLDDYTANAPLPIDNTPYSKEALQCCLHEMMHMALWDDVTISHSPYKTSLLYYYVDGSVLSPNSWDLQVMTTAAKRIGQVIIETQSLGDSNISIYLVEAVRLWNAWIGREFYKLL